MRKSREEVMKDAVEFSKIPGCQRVIGYGSYFKKPDRFTNRSDIDICVVVNGDTLSAMPILRNLEGSGVIRQGPGQYHIWVLNEQSLQPSKRTGEMHEHSKAIMRDGVTLWVKQ